MDEVLVENLHQLYDKYSENAYATEKLTQYLKQTEEYVIQQIQEKQERDERRRLLEQYREIFVKDFLMSNN